MRWIGLLQKGWQLQNGQFSLFMGNGKMLSFTRGQTAHDNSATETEINTIKKNTRPHFFVKSFREESLKFKIKGGKYLPSDHVGIHQLSDGLSLVTWFRKNKYCSIDIGDHKEIHCILVILQHKIINFETTKLILPRISMYLKS